MPFSWFGRLTYITSGGSGIRTHGGLPTLVFKTSTFIRSAIPPRRGGGTTDLGTPQDRDPPSGDRRIRTFEPSHPGYSLSRRADSTTLAYLHKTLTPQSETPGSGWQCRLVSTVRQPNFRFRGSMSSVLAEGMGLEPTTREGGGFRNRPLSNSLTFQADSVCLPQGSTPYGLTHPHAGFHRNPPSPHKDTGRNRTGIGQGCNLPHHHSATVSKLSRRESNPDRMVNSHPYYRYTTGEYRPPGAIPVAPTITSRDYRNSA
jgi:hypothetical protein